MRPTVLVIYGLTYCISIGVFARHNSCTTPTGQPGLCVPLQQCRNILNVIQGNKKPSEGILNYIRKSVCQLPGISKAVCCRLTEVDESDNKPTLPKLPKECGSKSDDRIAYGEETAVFEYPWMALLRYRDNDNTIVDGCGGSLIHERFVLTAAHCIKVRSYILDHVRLGEQNKITDIDCDGPDGDCAGPVQDIRVENTIVHPQYNIPKFRNDIGLIRLEKTVQFEGSPDHIKPICLPITSELRSMLHPRYILSGWGTTENYSLSNLLLKVTLPRIENSQCENIMKTNGLTISLSNKQMCAGGKDLQDSCKGDSGGPLGTVGILHNEPRFIQFGIVSAGVSSCGQKVLPSIYTRVGEYMDWILDNLKPS